MPKNFIPLGIVPAVVKKRVLTPRIDDMAKLVLLGGGDFASMIWAWIKVKVRAVAKWIANGATDTPAFMDRFKCLKLFTMSKKGALTQRYF